VEVRSANDAVRVPWAFVKAARMRVRYTDDEAEARVFYGGPGTNGIVFPSIGRNLFEMLVPPGTYSLVVMTFAEVEPRHETTMIVRDAQFIEGEQEFDLTPADAPYRLTFAANDELGRPLRREGSGAECLPFRYLLFHTQAFGMRGFDLIYSTGTWREVNAYPPDIRTSSITDRYSFFSGEVCLDAAQSKFYVLEYPVIRGVNGDVTREAGGGDLRGQAARLVFPPASDGLRSLGLAARFVDAATATLVPGFYLDRWPSPEWNGTVFLSRRTDPDLALQGFFEAQTDQAWLATHPLRLVDGGVASFSSWVPSPTTFVASPADRIDFGLGPVIPKLVVTGAGNGAEVQASFAGPLDETIVPAKPATFRLFNRDGRFQRAEETDRFTVDDLTTTIRVELEAFRPPGGEPREGRTFLKALFGGARADRFPPTLTSLSVLDARSQPVNRLVRGLPARLRFSAIDAVEGSATPGRVKPDATGVWVRPAATGLWRRIPVTVHDDDFEDPAVSGRDPAGTIFECSLSEVAATEGVFDLRILVEDASANATETTFTEAFEVTAGQPRTRAVRH
jgi:hypothetical protein